jgi:putative transposase
MNEKRRAMAGKRKQYSSKFEKQVAVESLKEQKTISELASEYGVHPNQISNWRKQLMEGAEEIFSRKRKENRVDTEGKEAKLYEEIGRLKIELDWLKKKSGI